LRGHAQRWRASSASSWRAVNLGMCPAAAAIAADHAKTGAAPAATAAVLLPLLPGLRMLSELLRVVWALARVSCSIVRMYLRMRVDTTAREQCSKREAEFSDLLEALPSHATVIARRLSRSRGRGKGIVVVAGGPTYGALALRLVNSLRAHGSTLPIEVFHLGQREMQCDEMRELASYEGVSTRDLLALHPTLPQAEGFGYAAKPLAIAASSFEEVLLCDADNTVCRNPDFLLGCDAYLQTGAVFWCDMYAYGERFVGRMACRSRAEPPPTNRPPITRSPAHPPLAFGILPCATPCYAQVRLFDPWGV